MDRRRPTAARWPPLRRTPPLTGPAPMPTFVSPGFARQYLTDRLVASKISTRRKMPSDQVARGFTLKERVANPGECASTIMASRSTTIGPSVPTGGLSCQTRSRAAPAPAAPQPARPGRGGGQRGDQARDGRVGRHVPEQVGLRAPQQRRPGSHRPARQRPPGPTAPCPDRARHVVLATAAAPRATPDQAQQQQRSR